MITKIKRSSTKLPAIKALLLVAALPLLGGCVKRIIRSNELFNLSIGMDKNHVIEEFGLPALFRGSMLDKTGQVVEVFEYSVNTTLPWFEAPVIETYWLYFHNNKLVQWGKAGDWQAKANHISEIRFR